jgi:hypothetical protein
VLASGILLLPSTPTGVFFGNWTPEVGGLAPYSGTLLSASLGSYPLPSERLDDPDRVASALESGEPFALRFVAGPSPEVRAPLFRLIGEGQREVMRIDVVESDVLVRPRYLATWLRLSRPELTFDGALSGFAPGDTVTMTVAPASEGGIRLELEEPEPTVRSLGPTQGWVVVSNIDGLPAHLARVADFLWGLLLFFPLGWWASSLATLAGATLPVLIAAGLVPALTPLAPAPVLHLAVAPLFGLAGYLLARVARMRLDVDPQMGGRTANGRTKP